MFAHRGGAGEVPESTALAFQHAIAVGADVLEVDLRLTADKQIVVWHGPKLDNVFGLDGDVLQGRDIRKAEWKGLAGKAWVIHPGESKPYRQSPQRQLLSFEEFVNTVERLESERELRHKTGWNIELKPSCGWDEKLPLLFSLLDQQVVRRKIAIAVAFGGIANVRAALKRSPVGSLYATNLTLFAQSQGPDTPLPRGQGRLSIATRRPNLVRRRDTRARRGRARTRRRRSRVPDRFLANEGD